MSRLWFRLITLDEHGRRREHQRTVDVFEGARLSRLELWGRGGLLGSMPIGLDEDLDDDDGQGTGNPASSAS